MGADKIVIEPLQQVQNFAARLILGASRRQPTTPLLKSLHWLPISERIKFKVCCICFNSLTHTAPQYITDILPPYSNLSKLRSASDTRKLQKIRYKRKTHGYRSLQYYGPQCFNELPRSVRDAENIKSFKSQLKTHLFKNYLIIIMNTFMCQQSLTTDHWAHYNYGWNTTYILKRTVNLTFFPTNNEKLQQSNFNLHQL